MDNAPAHAPGSGRSRVQARYLPARIPPLGTSSTQDVAISDWGTVVQRRVSREQVEKGGMVGDVPGADVVRSARSRRKWDGARQWTGRFSGLADEPEAGVVERHLVRRLRSGGAEGHRGRISEGRAGGGYDDPAGLVQEFHRAAAGFDRPGAGICDILEFAAGVGGGRGSGADVQRTFSSRERGPVLAGSGHSGFLRTARQNRQRAKKAPWQHSILRGPSKQPEWKG